MNPQADAINGKIARLLNDTYNVQHRAERIADAAELQAAESFAAAGLPLPRRKRVVMTSVNTCEKSLNVVDTDWAAFVRKVEQTDTLPMMVDRE